MKSITRKDGGMYQCFAFGIDHNDIAIGSSQLDLGGKKIIFCIIWFIDHLKFLLQTYHIDIVLIISTRFCTRHNIDISIPIDSSKSTISIGLRCNRKPEANFTVGPWWRCYCKFKPHYTANENSIDHHIIT